MSDCVTHKLSRGNYRVSVGPEASERFVDVKYFDHLKGWIAAASWDRHLYSDPLVTKQRAVQCAQRMLTNEGHPGRNAFA